MLRMGAAHAGVHTTGDPDDPHAWVTTKGELQQIKKGMREARVNRILDSKGRGYGTPRHERRYGGQRTGIEHASAVISYDNRRRVKYKYWMGTESFHKGDVTVFFFHVEPGNPYSVKREFLSVTNFGNRRVGYTLTDEASGRTWNGTLRGFPGERRLTDFCAIWPSKT